MVATVTTLAEVCGGGHCDNTHPGCGGGRCGACGGGARPPRAGARPRGGPSRSGAGAPRARGPSGGARARRAPEDSRPKWLACYFECSSGRPEYKCSKCLEYRRTAGNTNLFYI